MLTNMVRELLSKNISNCLMQLEAYTYLVICHFLVKCQIEDLPLCDIGTLWVKLDDNSVDQKIIKVFGIRHQTFLKERYCPMIT